MRQIAMTVVSLLFIGGPCAVLASDFEEMLTVGYRHLTSNGEKPLDYVRIEYSDLAFIRQSQRFEPEKALDHLHRWAPHVAVEFQKKLNPMLFEPGAEDSLPRHIGLSPEHVDSAMSLFAGPWSTLVFAFDASLTDRVREHMMARGDAVDGLQSYVTIGEPGHLDLPKGDVSDPVRGPLGQGARVHVASGMLTISYSAPGTVELEQVGADIPLAAVAAVEAIRPKETNITSGALDVFHTPIAQADGKIQTIQALAIFALDGPERGVASAVVIVTSCENLAPAKGYIEEVIATFVSGVGPVADGSETLQEQNVVEVVVDESRKPCTLSALLPREP